MSTFNADMSYMYIPDIHLYLVAFPLAVITISIPWEINTRISDMFI